MAATHRGDTRPTQAATTHPAASNGTPASGFAPPCAWLSSSIAAAFVAVTLGFLASAPPAHALTYALPSDESMVDRAAIIVHGLVTDRAPGVDGDGRPFTEFTVSVGEVLKGGVGGSTVMVRQPGGALGTGLAMRIAGLHMLREGDRVLLFLSERGEAHRIVDFDLGVFFERQIAGQTLLERTPSLGERVLPGTSDAAADETLLGPRDSELFRRWIQDRAAGTVRPADYFVPEGELEGGPQLVILPYRHTRSADSCEYPGESIRWIEFEQGNPVTYRIQEGGDPAFGEDTTREIVAAATAAWNDDPGSLVNLQIHPEPSAPAEQDYRDGINLLMFEDPFEDGDELVLGEGGTLAWAPVWYVCNVEPMPRPAPNQGGQDHRIYQADVVTARNLGEWLAQADADEATRQSHLAELMTHEIGHGLGFSHPCGANAGRGAEFVPCETTAEQEAIMRGSAHLDGRGAQLSDDDRTILRILYSNSTFPVSPHLGEEGYTDCEAAEPSIVLEGHEVWMCYETPDGTIADALGDHWGPESGVLWFFQRSNAEVLIKVLEGCAYNQHRWVFASPATDLAFNLLVRSPDGEWWSHYNRQGDPASPRRDTSAFDCE